MMGRIYIPVYFFEGWGRVTNLQMRTEARISLTVEIMAANLLLHIKLFWGMCEGLC